MMKKKEDKSMSFLLKNDKQLKNKLNRISTKADYLTGKYNMIELNPNNKSHIEWFEHDKYKKD